MISSNIDQDLYNVPEDNAGKTGKRAAQRSINILVLLIKNERSIDLLKEVFFEKVKFVFDVILSVV